MLKAMPEHPWNGEKYVRKRGGNEWYLNSTTMTLNDSPSATLNEIIHIPVGNVLITGELHLPEEATGLVLFAHRSRHSPRNQVIAEKIAAAGFGTLLLDLLTPEEQQRNSVTGVRRFDIELLARRITGVVRWLDKQPQTCTLEIGCTGAGIGAAAALIAAAGPENRIAAVVSRAGRPDLAGEALAKVRTPTLLIVGGNDEELLMINEDAFATMRWRRDIRIIPEANPHFSQPGKLDQVAQLSAEWFCKYLAVPARQESWQ